MKLLVDALKNAKLGAKEYKNILHKKMDKTIIKFYRYRHPEYERVSNNKLHKRSDVKEFIKQYYHKIWN